MALEAHRRVCNGSDGRRRPEALGTSGAGRPAARDQVRGVDELGPESCHKEEGCWSHQVVADAAAQQASLTELAAHDKSFLRRCSRKVRGVLDVILRPLAAILKRVDEREGRPRGEQAIIEGRGASG